MAQRAKLGFGMRVVGVKRDPSAVDSDTRALVDDVIGIEALPALLPRSDYVVWCCESATFLPPLLSLFPSVCSYSFAVVSLFSLFPFHPVKGKEKGMWILNPYANGEMCIASIPQSDLRAQAESRKNTRARWTNEGRAGVRGAEMGRGRREDRRGGEDVAGGGARVQMPTLCTQRGVFSVRTASQEVGFLRLILHVVVLQVSILPGTPGTRHFWDRERIAMLPKHGVFINIGRGTAVDEDALADALEVLSYPFLYRFSLPLVTPFSSFPFFPLSLPSHLFIFSSPCRPLLVFSALPVFPSSRSTSLSFPLNVRGAHLIVTFLREHLRMLPYTRY